MGYKYDPTNRSEQNPTQWFERADANSAVLARTGGALNVSEQDTPDMTVLVSAGALLVDTTLTEVAEQSSGTITAPAANPRIDLVYLDTSDGSIGVETGAEAASPTAPAIPPGCVPLAEIALATTTTAIIDSLIADRRPTVSLVPGDADTLDGHDSSYFLNILDFATQTQAEDGTVDDVVMSPEGATQHFNDRLNGFFRNGLHVAFAGDLDTILHNSKYVFGAASCTNIPAGMSGWGFVETDMHINTDYATQRVFKMINNVGYSWTRLRAAASWQAWVADGINGDADTLDGYHAAAFAPVDTANNGMLEYVNSFPFSAVANIDFTSLTPGRYRVLFEDVYGSNGTPLRLQAIDSTVISATNYMYTLNHGTLVTSATFIQLGSSKATSVYYGMDGAVDITLGALSGKRFQAAWQLNLAAEYMVGAGAYSLSTIEADGFRIIPESGTITGTIHLYKFKDV